MLDAYQIRAGRALLGVTQQELASAAGISVASLNNIERNIAKPRAATLKMLKQVFFNAGLSFEQNETFQSLYFNRFGRPGSYDAALTYEQLTHYFNPDSLLKIKRIIFFTFDLTDKTDIEIGIVIETSRRVILLDHMKFSFQYAPRIELLGNAMLQIFTLYGEQTYLSTQHVKNIHQLKVDELLAFLDANDYQKMRHPQQLFAQLPNWQEKMRLLLNIPDHPIKRLYALLEHLIDD
ncbi:MAG: helix-turn-helix domain-containing protein [Alphaproteobacteria bacterium]|nr:helix-turn-helix domain-containing protein [Alphaproteobacteria bacterium]